MRKIITCDFDGTITVEDTLDAMQEELGRADWREGYEALYAQGYTIREAIRKMMEELTATRDEIAALMRTIEVRKGFGEFVGRVRLMGYEFIIQSEGIDLAIETVLGERGFGDIPYFTNRFVTDAAGRPSTVNGHSRRECDSCGNCKSGHLIEARRDGAGIVYIGDGITDRCPAPIADVVFARGGLAAWCGKKGMPFHGFEDFYEVLRQIERDGFEERLATESRRDLEFKTTLPCRDIFERTKKERA